VGESMGRGETQTGELSENLILSRQESTKDAGPKIDAIALVRALATSAQTAREIADELNGRGIPTTRGLNWEAMHVYKLARSNSIEIKGRATILPATLTRLCDLYQESRPLEEIVTILNSEGHTTASGKAWSIVTLSNALQRAGVKRTRNERKFDEKVIRRVIDLRLLDYSLDRIARVLTQEGLETPLKGRWWPATVKTVIDIARQRSGLNEQEKNALSKKRSAGSWPKANPRARVDKKTIELIVSLRQEKDEEGNLLTFQAIAEKLDEMNVPTAREAENWRASTVRAIFSSAPDRLSKLDN
jgi:hypothetical protein